jgi:hypothetical protein
VSVETAQLVSAAAAGYAVVGAAFAVAFVTVGAGRLDPAARGASPWFRLIILPASVALWPVLAILWLSPANTAEPREDHP